MSHYRPSDERRSVGLEKGADQLIGVVDNWLARLEQTIAEGGEAALGQLFHVDSYWRDLLAMTWRIQTLSGQETIRTALPRYANTVGASGFKVAPARTPPRSVTRAGTEAVEAFFSFQTREGRGIGVVRLRPDPAAGGKMKAWTFMTALDSLKDYEEQIGRDRPTGQAYSRDFRGPNWLDLRRAAQAYKDRDPTVLVVGGGQAGLSMAARLGQLGVDTLIVDRHERIGDNWRKRYHALTLHNQVHVNHLPYMPFPPNWPAYIPKDKLANWFEAYAESMELNFWTGTEFAGGAYDEGSRRWTATLRRLDGSEQVLHPCHIVMATGVSGIPNWTDISSLQNFKGAVLHSSEYRDGDDWTGKTAMVIGTGNSGHDIAQDLHSSGVQVTLVQRSSTLIVNIEPSAQLPYALYDEGPPLEDCDLITTSMPLPLVKKIHSQITGKARELDKPLLDGLQRVGFKLDFGDDDTGWQFKYLTRGGGYCFNVGCSDLIVDGKVGLVQFDDIEAFTADGAKLTKGDHLAADVVILATGYQGQEVLVERLFGAEIAERVGPIWGFGDDLELRNMYGKTGQPGLWFIAGSFAQCRIYSKYLGLQIKACEEDLLS